MTPRTWECSVLNLQQGAVWPAVELQVQVCNSTTNSITNTRSGKSLRSFSLCSALTESASMWQQLLGGQGGCQSRRCNDRHNRLLHYDWTSQHRHMSTPTHTNTQVLSAVLRRHTPQRVQTDQTHTDHFTNTMQTSPSLANTQPVTQAYVCLAAESAARCQCPRRAVTEHQVTPGLSSLSVPRGSKPYSQNHCIWKLRHVYTWCITTFKWWVFNTDMLLLWNHIYFLWMWICWEEIWERKIKTVTNKVT